MEGPSPLRRAVCLYLLRGAGARDVRRHPVVFVQRHREGRRSFHGCRHRKEIRRRSVEDHRRRTRPAAEGVRHRQGEGEDHRGELRGTQGIREYRHGAVGAGHLSRRLPEALQSLRRSGCRHRAGESLSADRRCLGHRFSQSGQDRGDAGLRPGESVPDPGGLPVLHGKPGGGRGYLCA